MDMGSAGTETFVHIVPCQQEAHGGLPMAIVANLFPSFIGAIIYVLIIEVNVMIQGFGFIA